MEQPAHKRFIDDLPHFFRLSRPINLLISALSLGLAAYLGTGNQFFFVKDPRFWLSMVCVVLVAASGYWINDVYDFRIDRINKPKRTIVNAILSVKKVMTAYFIVISIVLLISTFFLPVEILFLNVLAISLLFVYASYLKRISVAGNLIIAFLTSLVLILSGFLYQINFALIWGIVFAFEVTLLREITKDIEDIEGDLAYNLQTLPIQIGVRKTKRILLALYISFFFPATCQCSFLKSFMTNGWSFIG